MKLILPSPLQELKSAFLDSKKIRLLVKRDDLIHPVIGGNKWRKLKYNIKMLQENKPVLSFGGAYSNHIYALAGAGKAYGFKTIGIIRGEVCEPLNPTLMFAKKSGMYLHYISRKAYRLKESPVFIESLRSIFGDFSLLPEGGSNTYALPGCAEIIAELDSQLDGKYDCVCVPCGTGGTLAGLISSGTEKKMLGISVLKGEAFLKENIEQLLKNPALAVPDIRKKPGWEIIHNYHFNGYAKKTHELQAFVSDFYTVYDIHIEPVYSGKMFFGLFDLIKNDYFSRGSTIVALHTGGLQNEKF